MRGVSPEVGREFPLAQRVSNGALSYLWPPYVIGQAIYMFILNEVIASDHKPISFDIAGININHTEISVTVDSDVCSVPMWSNCGDKTLAYYTSYVDHLLQYNHSL